MGIASLSEQTEAASHEKYSEGILHRNEYIKRIFARKSKKRTNTKKIQQS